MISVLIPAYNAEKTIEACLDSVLSQTFQDFEIVVINDGSTDATSEILDAYAEKDSRIRVFCQKNAGVSAARNRAVSECHSEEMTFLDSDDRLLPTYLEMLHRTMCRLAVSCVCCNHLIIHGDSRTVCFDAGAETVMLSSEQALENLLYHGIPNVSPWGKLYTRELLTQIRYPEGKLFEDTYVIADVIVHAGQIAFVPEPLYEYILYEDSISRTCNEEHIWDLYEAVDHMTRRVEQQYPHMKPGCIRRRVHGVLSVLRTLDPERHSEHWRRGKQELLRHGWRVIRDKRAPVRDKIGIIAALGGHRCYRLAWKLYENLRRKHA